jgi:hypothetical protein
MWESRIERLDDRTHRVVLSREQGRLRYSEVVDLWQKDDRFRSFFISLLVESPFLAYFWETPPVTETTLTRPFEFVLVDSPQLARVGPEPAAFADQFRRGPGRDVVTFRNLGGDAMLVAPCPRGPVESYAHLAAFTRGAAVSQQHRLWQEVGRAVTGSLGPRPTWVSTCGLGVFWLHVRLDSRPKYYTYGPYSSPRG